MYLYVLTLHSGSQPKTEAKPDAQPEAKPRYLIEFPGNSYKSPPTIPSWDLRGNPPMNGASETKQQTEALGVRLWFSKEAVEPAALESILKTAYTFGFGKYTQINMLERGFNLQETSALREILRETEFHFRATRIELPEGMDASSAQDEFLSFWDASGTKLSVKPRDGFPIVATEEVNIPYVAPPKEFRCLEDVRRFADYIVSIAAMEKAKAAWRGEMSAIENVNGHDDSGLGNTFHFTEAEFETEGQFYSSAQQKELKEKRSRDRALIIRVAESGKVVKKVLLPCDATPWFGTSLLPEFKIVKAVDWASSVGYVEEATLASLMEALAAPAAAETTHIHSSRFGPSERYFAEQAIKHGGACKKTYDEFMLARKDGLAIENKPITPAKPNTPEFPYQEDLNTLWNIFTREYIQRPKRKGGLPPAPIPNSILLAVWKMLALQPKSAFVLGNPRYENSIICRKDVPKNWSKVVTPEVLTEYFYAKGDKFEECILYSFYNRQFLNTLFSFYNINITINDELDWSTVPAIDPNPVVLAMTNPAGLTEEHKKGWIAKFVKENMDTKEKAVAGSQETYSEFISWVRNGSHISFGGRRLMSMDMCEKFMSQFPQAEFTRLMKENGLAMTRRSRGMVYVGAALRSKCDDDLVERVPAEGEILPAEGTAPDLGLDTVQGVGPTGGAGELDGAEPFESAWAQP